MTKKWGMIKQKLKKMILKCNNILMFYYSLSFQIEESTTNNQNKKLIEEENIHNQNENENAFLKLIENTKNKLWDPLSNTNKVMCICSSLCFFLSFCILFYSFFITT
jgi:hypothetical protein